MQFFIPVPKVWEWVEPFPFPFPNVKKSFPLAPASVQDNNSNPIKYIQCMSYMHVDD